MLVKCSTARILLTVVLSAELVTLVFSGEILKKSDEKVAAVDQITPENVGEYFSEHSTRRWNYDTLPTTNYATSEAPTSSSSWEIQIGDKTSIKPNREPTRYNESNNLPDTINMQTAPFEKLKELGETDKISSNNNDKSSKTIDIHIDDNKNQTYNNDIMQTRAEATLHNGPSGTLTADFNSTESATSTETAIALNADDNKYQSSNTGITKTARGESTLHYGPSENSTTDYKTTPSNLYTTLSQPPTISTTNNSISEAPKFSSNSVFEEITSVNPNWKSVGYDESNTLKSTIIMKTESSEKMKEIGERNKISSYRQNERFTGTDSDDNEYQTSTTGIAKTARRESTLHNEPTENSTTYYKSNMYSFDSNSQNVNIKEEMNTTTSNLYTTQSQYPTVSTTDNAISEASTISSNSDTVIEEITSVNSDLKQGGYDESNTLRNTFIMMTQSSEKVNEIGETDTILSDKQNERFTSTETATDDNDYQTITTGISKIARRESTLHYGPTENSTTDYTSNVYSSDSNSQNATVKEEINTTPSNLYTTQSQHPTVSTTDNTISEASTISSNSGTVFEEITSVNLTLKLVGYDESNTVRNTIIMKTESSEKVNEIGEMDTILSDKQNERFISIETATDDNDYQTITTGITKIARRESTLHYGPTENSTTDYTSNVYSSDSNSQNATVKEEINTTPSNLYTTQSQHPTVSTTDNTISEASTISSNSGTVFEEITSVNPTLKLVGYDESNTVRNTIIIKTESSEKVNEIGETDTISSDKQNEKFTSTETVIAIKADHDDYQTSTNGITKTAWSEPILHNGSTENRTTDFNFNLSSFDSSSQGATVKAEINTTPSSVSNTHTQKLASEMSTKSDSETSTDDTSSEITPSTVLEKQKLESDTSTSNISFESTTPEIVFENTTSETTLEEMVNKHMYNLYNTDEAGTAAYSQSTDSPVYKMSYIEDRFATNFQGGRETRGDKSTNMKASGISIVRSDPPSTTPVTYISTSETVTYKALTRRIKTSSLCNDSKITNYEISTIGKTSLKVNWTFAYSKDDDCQLKIELSCNSTEDSFDWIVTYQNTSTKVNGPEAVSSLENLSEFTSYSCIGQLSMKGQDEMILSNRTFDVSTLPEVPSNIRFKVTKISAKGFSLSWHRPLKIPGNLQKYYIVMKKTPSHYIRKECVSPSIGNSVSFSSGQEIISYDYLQAEPHHLYEVQILAEDEAGNSTGIKQRFSTNSSRSTEPLNVTSILHNYTNHCKDDNYNTTLQLNWELPCNTNGKLIKFEVQITEIIYSDSNSYHTGSNTRYEVDGNSEIKKLTYELMVQNLNASCSYNVTIAAITGNDIDGFPTSHITQRTRDGCPSEPSKIESSVQSSSSFSLHWDESEEFFGKIIDYTVKILNSGPKHELSNDPTCKKIAEMQSETFVAITNSTSFTFMKGLPNFEYNFTIEARTSAGIGKPSEAGTVITYTAESQPIRNLEIRKTGEVNTDKTYEYKVRITFKEPCNTNGHFEKYLIEQTATRNGYPNVHNEISLIETTHDEILRRPENHYEFEIKVVTENENQSPPVKQDIITSAAIPILNENKLPFSVNQDNPSEIKVNMEKEMFSNENGDIIQYDIFLFEGVDNSTISKKPSFGICSGTCPGVDKSFPFIKAASIHQVTSSKWNPFIDGIHRVNISIGKKEHCVRNEFCQPVLENTNYIVLLRGITKSTYRDIFVFAKTGIIPSSSYGIIISMVVLLVIVVLGIYLYLKRDRFLSIRFRSIPSTVSDEEIPRHVVAVKHFIAYCNKIASDPTILRKQYEEIDDGTKKYKEQNVHTVFALKPENIRKNRYTNILPYDEYRVRLNMDEDDEISSDYINASYIRGASGEVEYIATQGPLEHTCKDFWKMVIQENVTVIVMVSQFVEKEKEKCFKYFPNNHENMLICEDLEVKCLTELQFDTHCIRTLLIRKNMKQFSIIHMQYLDWPDFGCPSGTYNMISFCQDVRDRIQFEKGLMAVHCSAGVGRTGTLISLDMLLQTMKRKKEISVFECVMDLRKQRTHMVQTEKQYVYIHSCLKDVLENCSSYAFDDIKKDDEHIYQNVNEKKRAIKGSEGKQEESAF